MILNFTGRPTCPSILVLWLWLTRRQPSVPTASSRSKCCSDANLQLWAAMDRGQTNSRKIDAEQGVEQGEIAWSKLGGHTEHCYLHTTVAAMASSREVGTPTSLLCDSPHATKGASTRSYTRLFYLVLLYVYDLLSLVHVQKYVCVYEYDVLQPCWIFVRRTRVRRTNVRASFLEMSLLSSLAFQIWCFTRYTL